MSNFKSKFKHCLLVATFAPMVVLTLSPSVMAEKKTVNAYPANGMNASYFASSCNSVEGNTGTLSGDKVSCGNKHSTVNCDVENNTTKNCTETFPKGRPRPKKFNTAGGEGHSNVGNGNATGGGTDDENGNTGDSNPGGGRPDSAGGVGAGGSPGSVSSGNDNSGNGGIN